MANLQDAVNQVIGTPTGTVGLRYYSNWSTTSAPGVGAPNQLTIARKVEANPIFMLDDPDTNFPGVYYQILGMFPSTIVRGTHYECSFRIKVYYIGALANAQRPREQGRVQAIAITENVMASTKLGLDWVDSVQWAGCDYEDDSIQYLQTFLPNYYVGATRFEIRASGLTF